MVDRTALIAARIFDGETWHEKSAVLIEDGSVANIVKVDEVPAGFEYDALGDALLAPGFVDLQVNGGGGVMLNDAPSAGAIGRICRAHARYGTTALLPTLITDTRATTAAALAAAAEVGRRRIPGFLGLHLEGPHLALSRKGAHDPALIRPMDDADETALIAARPGIPVLLATVAPESVSPERISRLAEAGITISLGHSDAALDTVRKAAAAGASMATHLFNAMSQIGSREPGLAGAALALGGLFAGLIADGFHVAPETIGIALRAKRGPGRVFLVTDAMATIGTELTSFQLNGRTIHRAGGRLTLADGTLAGADLDMISAVRFMHRVVGLDLAETLRMASLYPAQAVRQETRLGHLRAGAAANIVAMSPDLNVRRVWIDGRVAHDDGSRDA
ncbi:MAG: N-acetylglucosamine-6-phosphate deacetylase [Rhizobiaceae bacterium]